MLKPLTLLTFITALCSPLEAQGLHPKAQTFDDHDHFVPANPNNVEDVGGSLPADLSGIGPVPAPVYGEAPTSGPGVAISYDWRTGMEIVHQPVTSAYAPSGFVTGKIMGDIGPPEGAMRSFGDLSAVTSSAYPWSTQVRMTTDQGSCSGTLIDAKHIITAGHCIHEGAGGTWHTNIQVAPAWDGDDDAFGSSPRGWMLTWSNWVNSSDPDGDQGIVELTRPVGILAGWLGYGYDDNNSWWGIETFHTAGYPGNLGWPGAPNQLYYGNGTWDRVYTDTVEADGPPWPFPTAGMSGSGDYYVDYPSGERFVFSNHTLAWPNSAGGVDSWGSCRITGPKFTEYSTVFIPSNYPSAQVDLVPLDVNVSLPSTEIIAGEALLSLDYVVGNVSLFDPGSQTWQVKVYLSMDGTIESGDTLIQTHSFNWDFSPKGAVRIISSSPPVIPEAVAAGDYYIGVMVDVLDADPSNNSTNDWDAVPIRVIRYWPNIPNDVEPIGTGLEVDFDSLFGVVPNWMAANELQGDHRSWDPEAWCNIGQRGACQSAHSGIFALEMGLSPWSTNYHEVANGLILGLDEGGPGDLYLNYFAINHGEDASDDDGIFISEDGATWVKILAGWSGINPFWFAAEEVELSGSGVNTSGPFYLLFGQADNYPYGYLDGIGIDDIEIAPERRRLAITPVYDGSSFTISVSHCTPGIPVYLGLSAAGGGPTSTTWGDAFLTSPWHILGPLIPDAAGNASLSATAGVGSTGVYLWMHAIELPSGEFTNPIEFVIR